MRFVSLHYGCQRLDLSITPLIIKATMAFGLILFIVLLLHIDYQLAMEPYLQPVLVIVEGRAIPFAV